MDMCAECDPHARCINGKCFCRRGFKGDGFSCKKGISFFQRQLSKYKTFQFYICGHYIFHTNLYYYHSIHWENSRFKRPLKTQQPKCTLKKLIKRSYKRKFVDIWFGMPLSGYKSTLFSPGETFPAIERLEQANVPVSYRKILSFPKRFKLDASNSDAKE